MLVTTSAIDLTHLNRSVFDDATLRAEVLGIFIEQADKILSQFDPSLDDDAWRHLAHTLKGGSRGVGAFALGDALAEAEMLCGEISDKYNRRAVQLERIAAECLAAITHAKLVSAESDRMES